MARVSKTSILRALHSSLKMVPKEGHEIQMTISAIFTTRCRIKARVVHFIVKVHSAL